MARGRMINKEICGDKKVNDLSCDTSRLAFTWLIIHADKEGRVRGDPAIVYSTVFPRRRNDVTVEDMESYISEWAAAGLVIWYEADDDMWIMFPSFDKNQVGLRKGKEPESIIPPLTDDCRIIGGQDTDIVRLKGREGKGKEPSSPNGEEDGSSGGNGRAKSDKDIKRSEIEEYFSQITKIPVPACNTNKQRQAAGVRWWGPLREILDMTDWDIDKAKKLTSASYHQMKYSKPKPLTVSAPQSILSAAISIKADWDRDGDGQRIIVDM